MGPEDAWVAAAQPTPVASDAHPPGFVLLADFGLDGLARPRDDTSKRVAELFEGRSRNDPPYVGIAADDPIVVALRREQDASLPRALRDTREPWRHVLALRSWTHLQIVLGRVLAEDPATAMLSRVRDAARGGALRGTSSAAADAARSAAAGAAL